MKLLRIIKHGARIEIRPDDILSTPLFIHCAGGMIAVEESLFRNVVQPILRSHGVDEFIFKDIDLLKS